MSGGSTLAVTLLGIETLEAAAAAAAQVQAGSTLAVTLLGIET